MRAPLPLLEDHVRMFHTECGGIVTGPLDDLTCAECGRQMIGFVSSEDEAVIGAAIEVREAEKNAPAKPKLKLKRVCHLCGQPIKGLFQLDDSGRAIHAQNPGLGCPKQPMSETNAGAAAQPLHAEASEGEDS